MSLGAKTRIGPSPWLVLAVAVGAQAGVSIIEQGMPTLAGFIKADLGLSAAGLGLVLACIPLGRILGAYAAGAAADRVGERTVLVVGGVALGLLVMLTLAAPLPALVPLLIVAGVASSVSTPAGGRLVLVAFPRERHGLALGIRQTGLPIGGIAAAALLPWIADHWSWRWSLVAGGIVAIATALPVALLGDRGGELEDAAHPRGPNPFRDPTLRMLTLWGCLLVSTQMALIAFLALDLHKRAGLSLPAGSLLVAVAQGAGIVGRIGWGAVSDRVVSRGRKPLLLALTSVGLVAVLLLLAVPGSAPIGAFVAAAALAGLTLIGFQGLWMTIIAEVAGPARVGAATGFAVTFAMVAVLIGTPLYGLVADLAGTYRAVWAALAVVLAVAFLPATLVHESRRETG